MSATPRRVDYEEVAPSFDRRYARNDYSGVAAALDAFLGSVPCAVLEVGCGTGHWLARALARGHATTGLDASSGMLARARAAAPAAGMARLRAEAERREARGEELVLEADLRLFATTAWAP